MELAADYIAAKFREEGVDPAGSDGSYFQIARFERITPDPGGSFADFKSGGKEVRARVRTRSDVAIDYRDTPVLKLPDNGPLPAMEGRIVAGSETRYGRQATIDELQSNKPALIVVIGGTRNLPPTPPYLEEEQTGLAPLLQIRDSDALVLLGAHEKLEISVHASAPKREEYPLRNVAAVLRGSDPELSDQYIILSAHYDHIGQNAQGIFHGANDDASGTASVIEIANALAAMNPHPKRSILFLTFFGEEKGLLGSYYYTHHPLVPLKDTVANVNLEQMGRTDDVTGPKIGTLVFAGQTFSNLPAIMGDAARAEGVQTEKRQDLDDYFDRVASPTPGRFPSGTVIGFPLNN